MKALSCFALGVLLACPVTLRAASHETDRAAVMRLAHQWLHASMTRDKAALARILADDFIDTSYRGKLRTKADMLAVSAAPHASQQLGDLKVRLYGDTAIMTGVNHVVGPHKAWTADVRFTDVYVKRRGRWHAVSAQETLIPPRQQQRDRR